MTATNGGEVAGNQPLADAGSVPDLSAQEGPGPVLQRHFCFPYVTLTIVALALAVHVERTLFWAGAPKDPFMRFGMSIGPFVWDGQWWRVLTSPFLHDNWRHLLENLALLAIPMWRLESVLGAIRTIGVLLVITVIADAAVLVAAPSSLGYGLSAIGCGATSAALVLYIRYWRRFRKSPLRQVCFWVIGLLSLLWGAACLRDMLLGGHLAHLTSLGGGLLGGIILCRPPPESGAAGRVGRWRYALIAACVLGACATIVVRYEWDRARSYLLLGQARLHYGQHRKAWSAFQRAVERDPTCAEAHLGMGESAWWADEPDTAVAAYEKAIELDPHVMSAYEGLLHVLRNERRWDEVIEVCTKALEIDPDDAFFHWRMGWAHYIVGDLDAAVAAMKTALAMWGDDATEQNRRVVEKMEARAAAKKLRPPEE